MAVWRRRALAHNMLIASVNSAQHRINNHGMAAALAAKYNSACAWRISSVSALGGAQSWRNGGVIMFLAASTYNQSTGENGGVIINDIYGVMNAELSVIIKRAGGSAVRLSS